MLDPLSATATVNVMATPRKIHVTDDDVSRAATLARNNSEAIKAAGRFAYKHADKVDVKLGKNGNVSMKYVSPASRANPPPSPHANFGRSFSNTNRSVHASGIHVTGSNANSSGPKTSFLGRRFIRMVGHKGLQEERMGIYVEHPNKTVDGRSAYKHKDGDWYLYYYERNKFWFIGSRIGKRAGWLYVQSEEKYPECITKSWRYWDDNDKKWIVDKNIACVHVVASELDSLGAPKPKVTSTNKLKIKTESLKPQSIRNNSIDDVSIFADSDMKESWFAALFTLYSSNPDF